MPLLMGGVALGVLVLAVVVFQGMGASDSEGTSRAGAGSRAVDAEARPSAPAPPAEATPSPWDTPAPADASPTASASSSDDEDPGNAKGKEKEEDIPVTGPGTFTTASGAGKPVGAGKILTYQVMVEDGLDVSAAEAAEEVDTILADKRGWTTDGTSGFRRVSSGTPDFVVQIATPGTVDDICGKYGLDTGGEVNCNVGRHVMVNLKRWLLATPVYADDVPSYRALIINHEVGHFLGHGHETCPGEGSPAPVMMQQIKGMHGCEPNVWPYTADGKAITGPKTA
ncbi:DUF3152 domain-containing protein [Streptomyces sp. NPDC095613]|uniref:DUF3152 domain-containing protein n=1 Tax=Streptomyces sp. NPDC095613 TaxID=3155540 RepID=UPI003324C757